MSVRLILESKGREVATIDPSATLGTAVKTLAERRIGALVSVGEGGTVIGILSERDIVRRIAEDGASCLDEPVASAMTRNVKTAQEDMTIDEAMDVMTRNRFRHLPVTEGGRLVGIVSIGDVVKLRIETVEREAEDMRSYIHAG
ncbi:CBS domain-containing protein [Aureimonas sp. AU12]|uniref:CBS domain-containing protein n=1 Tax=Aureimonas sp. AU12 TaxID=1638161 RepID=UPI0007848F50|nr:CBS domain-containing protein [Aureimonas sp. AU12]